MPAYTRPLRGAVLSRKWTSAHALGRTDYGTAENANGAHLELGNTAVLTKLCVKSIAEKTCQNSG